MSRIIYEKHYPSCAEPAAGGGAEGTEAPPFDTVLRRAEECAQVPIPGRGPLVPEFVRLAREASEKNRISVRIAEHADRVSADFFYHDGYGDLKFLRGLLDAADTACVSGGEGAGLQFTLELYTHATQLRGRRIWP